MATTSSCFTSLCKLDRIVFVGLFLLLMMLCQGLFVAARTCIECDSQREPNCANDTLLQPFEKNCTNNHTWCYIAQGNVTTLGYILERKVYVLKKVKFTKTARGCTKVHNDEQCIHMKQADSDFKVCHCKEELCNQNFIFTGKPTLDTSSAVGRTVNEIWGLVLLVAVVFQHWNEAMD